MSDKASRDSAENYTDRVLKLLKQQAELYGPFSLPEEPAAADQQEAAGNTGDASASADLPRTPVASENNGDNVTDTGTDTDTASRISGCNSLDELRNLCAEAEELKTDLEATRLVFGTGNPNADLMVIGEAPGENEDKAGEPFVGAAGQLLDKIIDAIGFSREEIYIANILKHRPAGNRNPLPGECEKSLPYLEKQIELVDPLIILTTGKIASTTLLKKDTTLGALRQKIHSYGKREVIATYHPAALLRNQKWKRPTWEDVQLLRKRYDELKAGKGEGQG